MSCTMLSARGTAQAASCLSCTNASSLASCPQSQNQFCLPSPVGKRMPQKQGLPRAQVGSEKPSIEGASTRRDVLMGVLAGSLALAVPEVEVAQAGIPQVGQYLPKSNVGDLVIFKPSPNKSPALRAGIIQPYQFCLPPTWKEQRVANIMSGNYCQPKCAEPWTEVIFDDPKQGSLQVIVSPLVRLTNDPSAANDIQKIGDPTALITSLGQFVTGNFLEPDEVVETDFQRKGDQVYYTYTVESPYARTGTHNLAVVTAKNGSVLLFVVSANDKQWAVGEDLLRTVQQSFEV